MSTLTRFLILSALLLGSTSIGAQIQNPIQAAKDAFKKAREQQKPPQPRPDPTPVAPAAPATPATPAAAAGDCCTPEALSKLASSVGFVDIVGVKLGMTLEQVVAAIKISSPKLVIDVHDMEINLGPPVSRKTQRPRWVLAHVPAGSRNPDFWNALDGSGDSVGVQLTPAPGPLVVDMVSRYVTFPNGQPVAAGTLQEALRKKYGPESYQDRQTIGWLFDTSGKRLGNLTLAQANCVNINAPQIRVRYRGGDSSTSRERIVLGEENEYTTFAGSDEPTAKCVAYVGVTASFDQSPAALVGSFETSIHSAGLQHYAKALMVAAIKQEIERMRRQEEEAGSKRAAPKL